MFVLQQKYPFFSILNKNFIFRRLVIFSCAFEVYTVMIINMVNIYYGATVHVTASM
jgi:hypothetical protein